MFYNKNTLRGRLLHRLTNIRGLRSSFVEYEYILDSKLSWRSCSVWDKLGWLNWFWQFLSEGLSSFNRKGFYYSCAGLSFAQDVFLKNSAYSYLCFRLALLHSASDFDFLYRSPSSSLCTVFDVISYIIDDVLSVSSFVNVFVFGDFNVYHQDWLAYSGGTDRSGKICCNFFCLKWPCLDG